MGEKLTCPFTSGCAPEWKGRKCLEAECGIWLIYEGEAHCAIYWIAASLAGQKKKGLIGAAVAALALGGPRGRPGRWRKWAFHGFKAYWVRVSWRFTALGRPGACNLGRAESKE